MLCLPSPTQPACLAMASAPHRNASLTPSAQEWELVNRVMDAIDHERQSSGRAVDAAWVERVVLDTYAKQGIMVEAATVRSAIEAQLQDQPQKSPHQSRGPNWAWRLKNWLLPPKADRCSSPTPTQQAQAELATLKAHRLCSDEEIKIALENDAAMLEHKAGRLRRLFLGSGAAWIAWALASPVAIVSIFPDPTSPEITAGSLLLGILAVFVITAVNLTVFFNAITPLGGRADEAKEHLKESRQALEALKNLTYGPPVCRALHRLGMLPKKQYQPQPIEADSSMWHIAQQAVKQSPELTALWKQWLESPKPIRAAEVWELDRVSSLLAKARDWELRRRNGWASQMQASNRQKALKLLKP